MNYEYISQFYYAICQAGYQPLHSIIPGKIHRFPGRNKKSSNRAGWCKLDLSCRFEKFGDWSSQETHVWKSNTGTISSEYFQELSRSKQLIERPDFKALWNSFSPCILHPYVSMKQISPLLARQSKGNIVLPMRNIQNNITGLQYINAYGRKRIATGSIKQGSFFKLSPIKVADAQHIVICEGWATGCTLAELCPEALIIVAFDANNLKRVAIEIRTVNAKAKMYIAGDDDRTAAKNTGRICANEAALASDALCIFPQWPDNAPLHLSDFNDLQCWINGGAL